MKKEKCVKWIPLNNIPASMCLTELKYDGEGLTINLVEHDNAPILTIYFDGDLAHRMTDEGNLLKIGSQPERESTEAWTLYKVENSKYLQWFHEQSCYVRKNCGLVHYMIATPNEVIDVLDLSTPTVMWN